MATADKLLNRLGWNYEQLQAIEFNEAFAVIDVLFARQHPDCLDHYNRFGGALAYGHPYGASGGILLAHLLKSLQAAGGGRGILAIAGAGGMGEAIALEWIS
jgi:acetyl-CoA C-acetyltransferase